ncbi:cell division protein FtsQ/DivIB [Gaetbulibacter aestuarii]|uniref:Cell division protein FtsQ n=1 Tax=Gaetbulibacter aestuarii TaxID=1502358 RepID=A0ABW7N2X4_9FLAO
MRFNWNNIRLVLLFGLMIFLFAFASNRNGARLVKDTRVTFTSENNLFITHENVSKLLIQNYGSLKNVPKDILDLNHLENALKSNPMIKSAEVYLAIDGTLYAEVAQKNPIARVSTTASYYVDDQGNYMPLSTNYSARVPLITGYVEKNYLDDVYQVADKVRKDAFLKTNVIEIHQDRDHQIALKLRACKFSVQLGRAMYLDKKINNLKAFYQKNLKDETLNQYSMVNLKFDNQVVCTKL